MARLLPSIMMMATLWLYFAIAVWGLVGPTGLPSNASQVACHRLGAQSGLCSRAGWDEISEDLFHQFQLIAQYAAASYCPGNNNSPNTPLTCPPEICPLLEEAAARSVSEFEDNGRADNTGFIAVDETNRLIVLSFRGSRSRANWKHDWNMLRTDTDLCPKCRAHKGFWSAWAEIRDTIKSQVLPVLEAYPDFRFAITGHSLGAAIATLAAGDFRKMNEDLGRRTEVFTFGSPRLGNAALVDFLTQQSVLSYRITNRKDIVPRLPPRLLGYRHTSPEYYIKHHSANPSRSDFRVYDGGPGEGNGATASLFGGFQKHRSYFAKDITACSRRIKDYSV